MSLSVRERPSLRLHIDVQSPSGRHARWGWDDKPENVPQQLQFSTTMPGGFERMSCVLERDPGKVYPDTIDLLSTITVMGAGGEVAWQGRTEKTPDTAGFEFQERPECVGWQAHLEDDNSAREIYVDQDRSHWTPPTLSRRIQLLSEGYDLEDGFVGASPDSTPAVVTQLTGDWARKRLSEAWYDAHGIPIGLLRFSWEILTGAHKTMTLPENWAWFAMLANTGDARLGEFDATPNMVVQGERNPNGGWGASTSTRVWAGVQLGFSEPSGAPGTQYPLFWTVLAVHGLHGLAFYGAEDQTHTGGLLASDVVRHAVGKWAPKLSTFAGGEGTIQASSFVILQLAFLEPTTAAEIVKQATRFELQDWAVWEGPTFYMNERGARGRKYRARVGPAQLQETGPQASRSWNGVIVSFSDFAGVTRQVGPPGSGTSSETAQLLDSDPENSANKLGIRRYATLKMGTASQEAAIKVGQVFLEQSRHLDRSGQAALVGYVEDGAGTLWPSWKVRGGDEISFVDAADPSYRRIVSTSYDDSSRTTTIQLDQPPETMQALLERLSVSLTSLGLS